MRTQKVTKKHKSGVRNLTKNQIAFRGASYLLWTIGIFLLTVLLGLMFNIIN